MTITVFMAIAGHMVSSPLTFRNVPEKSYSVVTIRIGQNHL